MYDLGLAKKHEDNRKGFYPLLKLKIMPFCNNFKDTKYYCSIIDNNTGMRPIEITLAKYILLNDIVLNSRNKQSMLNMSY